MAKQNKASSSGSVDNLNFAVIIDDKDFNEKIKQIEATAKKFNTTLSNALQIEGIIKNNTQIQEQSKNVSELVERYKNLIKVVKESADIENASLDKIANATEKMTKAKEKAAKAQADMIAKAQLSNGEITGRGDVNIANSQKKLDLTIQINQQIERLKQLEEEINVIQEIRQERGGGLSEEYKKAVKEAEKVQNVIQTLKQTQDNLNVKQPNYGEQARALSQQNITLKQMAAEYSTMEKKSQEAAKAQAIASKEAEKAVREEAKERAKASKEAEKQAKAESKALESAKKITEETKKTNSQLSLANRSVNQFASILRGSVSIYAMKRIMESIVTITGEFELQRTTLRAIIQDVNKADAIFSQIKDLALVSPFNFKDLISYTKQLSAFSIPTEELFDTTKMLADMSAGLGIGLDRLILAYGQVRSASFLRGQEVRQFTEAGVPILEALKNEFVALGEEGITVGQVFDKISTRQVPFEMVKKVLEDMTKEGGKFFNMQEIQSATLKGKLSNLKDAYQMFLNDVGSSMDGFLKGSVDLLRKLMENYEKIGRVLIDLIAIYGAYKTAVMVVNISDQIAKYGSLGKAIKSLTNAQKLLNSTILSNPYIFAATAITALVTLFIRARKEANRLNNDLLSITNNKISSAQGLIDDFDALCDRLKKAKVGTQEYRDSIKVLNNQYGEYLPNVLTEKNAIDELATSYTAVTESIYNKAKAEASTEGIKKIRDNYSEASQNYTELFISKLSGNGLARKDIAEMLKLYNDELKKQTGEYNPAELFNEVYKSYTNSDKGIFEGFTDFLNDVKQSTPFIRNIVDVNTTGWQTARDALWNYSTIFSQQVDAEKNFFEWLDVNYSATTYKTQEEKQKMEELNSKYDELFKNLHNNKKLSASEFQDAQFNLEVKKLEELLAIYKELGRGDEAAKIQGQIDKLTKSTEGWAGEVQKVLMSMDMKGGKSGGLWVDDTTVRTEYIKKLREEYAGWEQEYTDSQKKDKDYLLNRKKAMEAIFNVMGVSPITLKTTTGESEKSQAEKDLEAQAAAIKKVKDAYDTLSPYLNRGGMAGALKKLFPSVDEYIINNIENYRKQIEDVADSLDKIGDESSNKAAENLRLSVGGNEAQDMANTLRDIKEYKDLISKWTGIKFEIEGGGIEYKASKLAYEENKAIAESKQKKIEAEEKLYAIKSELHEKVYNRNLELIKELYDIEVANAKKITREKTIALAKGYIDEQLKDGNINLTDFRDKSAGQIKNLISRLGVIESQIRGEIGKISDVGEDTISDNDINKLELLREALNLIINITKDTEFELFKKSIENARKLNESVGQLGNQISTLGENIDSNLLKGLGDAVSTISEVADIILECDDVMDSFSKGTSDATDGMSNLAKSLSLITMMVKLALMFIEKIVNMFSAQYKYQQQLIESANEYQKTLDKLALNNYDTIFGVDAFGKYAYNVEIAERELNKYEKTLNKFKNKKGAILHPDMIGRGTTESAMKDIAKEQGWELYRTNGELNLEAMEAYYDSYSSRLTRKQKAMVKEMIETGKNYTDAQTAQAEYIESLFGNLSDNIADNMINAFLATGDAVRDLEDSFEDLGNTIAKSLLKSFIIDNVLKKYQDDLNILFEGYSKKEISDDEFSYKMGEMISGMKKDIKDGKEFWNVFLQYFQDAGLLTNAGDKDTNNMISGVSEETAQLLSSYINSMRAEQARQGIKIDNIDTNVMSICSWLTSIPNLGDYLTKIEASTQNMALNTKNILARLESVITTKGGSTSISIYEE